MLLVNHLDLMYKNGVFFLSKVLETIMSLRNRHFSDIVHFLLYYFLLCLSLSKILFQIFILFLLFLHPVLWNVSAKRAQTFICSLLLLQDLEQHLAKSLKNFLNDLLLRCNLHTIKFSTYIIQFHVFQYIHKVDLQNIFITSRENLELIKQSRPPHPTCPSPRQPLNCFLFLQSGLFQTFHINAIIQHVGFMSGFFDSA